MHYVAACIFSENHQFLIWVFQNKLCVFPRLGEKKFLKSIENSGFFHIAENGSFWAFFNFFSKLHSKNSRNPLGLPMHHVGRLNLLTSWFPLRNEHLVWFWSLPMRCIGNPSAFCEFLLYKFEKKVKICCFQLYEKILIFQWISKIYFPLV